MSGGQTGADRAALDWAIAHSVPHGGWCPKNRTAEDGRIEDRYQLEETPTFRYEQRTEWNSRDSDASVIFSLAPKLTGGSRLTAEMAQKHGKPWLHLSHAALGGDIARAAELLRAFLAEHGVKTLNIAGPRFSNEPEVDAFVHAVLDAAFPEDGAGSAV